MQASPLRVLVRSHSDDVRARIKTLIASTPHRTRQARLIGCISPAVCDVPRKVRSGLPGGRVGGGFLSTQVG